jgi:transcriptional repressor NF-X1
LPTAMNATRNVAYSLPVAVIHVASNAMLSKVCFDVYVLRTHVISDHSTTCPMDPTLHPTCPCGKHDMAELNKGKPRSSCDEPVLTCGESCGRVIERPCGHNATCSDPCHLGPCTVTSCSETTKAQCRCGHQTKCVLACGDQTVPLCDAICTTKLSCGKHACQTPCCIDTTHECRRVCGKQLKCGRHSCTRICHKGQCPPCIEASFDEYRCHCGQTTLVRFVVAVC